MNDEAPETAADERQEPPSEEELRARLDEELRKLRVQDVLIQSVVSLINLSSRRIAKEDERDLDQARLGIDAVRALVDFLDSESASQVRNALSELQLAYTRAAGDGEPSGEGEVEVDAPDRQGGAKQSPEPPAEKRSQSKPPPGLWTPPGAS